MKVVSNARSLSRVLKSPIFIRMILSFYLTSCRTCDDLRCQIDASIRILIAISAKSFLGHVLVWGPSTLTYAKEHDDVKLMMDVMTLLKENDLPLQSGTTDIVFSICYNSDNWKLMSKYSMRFVDAGVKLRRSASDVWMEFAAKIGLYKFSGDVESLWEIEKLRSESQKQHTVVSGFSCAKFDYVNERVQLALRLLKHPNNLALSEIGVFD